jgi:ABC-2 type transport system ATP-binding protein
MVQEINADQLEHLLRKRLIINARDTQAVRLQLTNDGYSVNQSENGNLEVTGKEATDHPEYIARILVQAGFPPTLLKVEEEDLESYFLRTIGAGE